MMRLHRRRLCSRASVGSGAAGDVPRTVPVEGSRIQAVTGPKTLYLADSGLAHSVHQRVYPV